MVGYRDMPLPPEYENTSARDLLLDLSLKKSYIETQIAEFYQILSKNNVGMHEPLVDTEGFPRNDIDVYQVRHARHRIICLQNDHKAIMQQLEEDLASYHAAANAACNLVEIEPEEDILSEAFACVKLVHPGSPADLSGLKENDLLVQFGSVTKENFKTMNDIATVVRCSIRREVLVIVRRQGRSSQLRLKLTPVTWSGQGFLGCKIDPIPFDNAER